MLISSEAVKRISLKYGPPTHNFIINIVHTHKHFRYSFESKVLCIRYSEYDGAPQSSFFL